MNKRDDVSDGEIFEDIYDVDAKDVKTVHGTSTPQAFNVKPPTRSGLIEQFRRVWKDCDPKQKGFWMDMYVPARDSILKTAFQTLQKPPYASFSLPGDYNRKREDEERSGEFAQRVEKQKGLEMKEKAAKEQTVKKEPEIKEEEVDRQTTLEQGDTKRRRVVGLHKGLKKTSLDELAHISCVMYEARVNEYTLVHDFPRYVSRKEESYTQLLLQLGENANLPAEPAKENASEASKLASCINNIHTAMALQASKPSTSTDHKAIDFHPTQNHLIHTSKFGTMIDYTLYRAQPESFWAHFRMSEALRANYPGVGVVTTHNPGFFFRQCLTEFHPTASRWMDPLLMMSDCWTGMLALPQLVEYGTTDWVGEGTRIFVTHLNHAAEWDAAGADPSLQT